MCSPRRHLILSALITCALWSLSVPTASADDNDLVLARLGTIRTDGMGAPTGVVGDNTQFRSLISELGVVLAPRLLGPADTLGYGGFQFTADFGLTSISNTKPYWRALQSSSGDATDGTKHGDRFMQTNSFFVRKGMWLPLPSFEMGVGAVHIVGSQMWAAQAYAKFALHEGYHGLPIPSIAVRVGGSRLMGAKDLDMTIASGDVTISKGFGIGGTVRLEPYGGYNLLMIVPRSEVIDKTPHINALNDPGDINMNFVFRNQDAILRHRAFFGAKLQYYVFVMTLEGNLAFSGSSVDDQSGGVLACDDATTLTDICDSQDQAGLQQTYTLSVGVDF